MPPTPGWRDSKGHLQGLQITDLAVGTLFKVTQNLALPPFEPPGHTSSSISAQEFSLQGVNSVIVCPEGLQDAILGSGSAQLCRDPKGLLRNSGHLLFVATRMGREERKMKKKLFSSVLDEALNYLETAGKIFHPLAARDNKFRILISEMQICTG